MKKEFVCKYCNTKFERDVYPSNKNKKTFEFCSPSCRNKSRALALIPCAACGKMIIPRYSKNKYGVRKYCSQDCSNKNNRGRPSTNPKTRTKEENEFIKNNYTSKGINIIQASLNISIKAVYQAARKLGLKMDNIDYSSRSDRMKMNNPMKNKETALKVGKIRSNRYWNDEEYRTKLLKNKAASNKKNMTKPELLCKQLLEDLKINAEYQVEVKAKFIVDFRIGNTILQVDGEYWHGHPRFEPLTERQIAQRKRDAAQDKYLTACGYRVVRIWENDITKENILLLLS